MCIIRDIAFKFYCDNQSAALLQRTRRFLSSTYRPGYASLKNFCARFTSLHLACLATNLNAISRIIRWNLCLISVTLAFSGCAHRKIQKPFTAEQAKQSLLEKSQKIQTVKGRAWLYIKTPQDTLSFPALVAIDRNNLKTPLLRIEAIDLLGATHVLLLLDSKEEFHWINLDKKERKKLKKDWYGIPLKYLPDLILGLAAPSETDHLVQYEFEWIDPGPQLALSKIEGQIQPELLRLERKRVEQPPEALARGSDASGSNLDTTRSNVKATQYNEKYIVTYTHFKDKADFYLANKVTLRVVSDLRPNLSLAQQMSSRPDWIRSRSHAPHVSAPDVKAPANPPENSKIEASIEWRERKWNEEIPSEAFLQ